MKKISLVFWVLLLLAIGCKKEEIDTGNDLDGIILISKTAGGCFTSEDSRKSYNKDLVTHDLAVNTLDINAGFNYNCCAELSDQIKVEGDKIKIYLKDDCTGDDCRCKCTCYYTMDYKFEVDPARKYYYFVFLENEDGSGYTELGNGCTADEVPVKEVTLSPLRKAFIVDIYL